ncbi:hypothetical protein DUNSADRAFT_13806 [Dunaliella salina]|uniref:Tbc2 translation factor, chloroplastic n=1 Tax=Dunaliella salina TaxID=3046 RepID=A0ABQ7G8K9_DUNSA|nr:hypothetical protein DUNSADRAFT_13806 [Dunaliella salina]|eukprot:KAF5830950.1 hypothetical protein DUNSADRAFT_13806 [Dunaliella salina]
MHHKRAVLAATEGLEASPQLLEGLEVHTMGRMHEGRPIDLANLASGCAGMRHRPSGPWAAAYLSAVLPKLRSYGIPELQMGSMASALARLNCRPDIGWLEECLAVSQRDLAGAGASQLVRLVSALAALRFRPGSAWMQLFLTVSFQRLAFYSPDQVVALLQAFARLGHRPQGLWLDELSSKVQARLQQFNGEQLAGMMGALARLRYTPDPDWLADFERASQSRLTTEISAGGLATIVWALAEMKHQPAPGWLYSFMLAAYRQLDLFDAMQLGIVFEALPRVSPHPSWLDELVQICATESSMRERSISSWSEEEEEMGWLGEDAETSATAAAAPSTGPLKATGWQSEVQGVTDGGHDSCPNQQGLTSLSGEGRDSSSSSSSSDGDERGVHQSSPVQERSMREDFVDQPEAQGQEQQQRESDTHAEASRSNRNGAEQRHSPPHRPLLGSRYRSVQCFAVGGGAATMPQQPQQQLQQQRFASSPRMLRVHIWGN